MPRELPPQRVELRGETSDLFGAAGVPGLGRSHEGLGQRQVLWGSGGFQDLFLKKIVRNDDLFELGAKSC